MRYIYAACGLTCLLVAGCVHYPELGSSVPAATISFLAGDDAGTLTPGIQSYSISENSRCTDTKTAARMERSALFSIPPENANVPAGRRIVILATTVYPARYGGGQKQCEGSASFIPEVGHTYQVTQRSAVGDACYTIVADAKTGMPPASLEVSGNADCEAFQSLLQANH